MNKKLTITLALAAIFMVNSAIAQSFLNSLKSTASSAVSSVVSAVTGDTALSSSSIQGTWTYSGAAVSLESDNVLTSAAGTLATSTIEEKLNSIFAGVGITTGAVSFTFNSDSSFSCTLKGKTLSGTYSISGDSSVTLNCSPIDSVNLGKITTDVAISGSDLSILFAADKLLELVDTISSLSTDSTLSTINSLLSAYDGVKVGFKLSK